MRGSAKRGALVVLAALVVAATAFASSAQGVHLTAAPAGPAPSAGCQLGQNGKIKHVIYLQFDNVHFNRDNPNVPSDLEQMPHLLNFLKDNGTLDTNDHTVLISHTGGGILSSLTGLYPDRHGQAVSNSYGYFRPDGSVGFSSSFKYWTDNTDGGNAATTPPTPSADTNYNMVNNDPASLGGNNGAVRNAPGPWVPYTRAGCDVGGAGLANIELENNTAISFAAGPTATTAAASAGATSIAVANRFGFSVGMAISIDAESNLESATIASISAGSGNAGTFTLTAPLTKSHLSNVTVYGPTAPDPTGDMTKVFGVGTPQWNEGQRSQKANPGTALRNLAQTDFVGYAIHCANGSSSICNGNPNALPDQLPDEAQPGGGGTNGYQGFKGLFGSQAVNPAINHGAACIDDINGPAKQITDQFNQCGFPGFDGLFPKNTLAEVATMQEAGVPVTFGYLSDAHDAHGLAGEIHHAYGPGEAGYVEQLKDYDNSFAKFFARMQADGITKKNSLFVITVEEGDHFAGTHPDAPCDGVTTPCTYQNVSEVQGDLKRMVATYNASHGTSATTNFSVHSDMAPNVYITGNPATGSPTARTLEKAMSDMTVTNPYSGQQGKLFVAMADPVEEKLLHMTTADPARTPTFTPFAQGDYFLSASSTTPCTGNDLNACSSTAVSNPNQSFAWNHGGVQPEVRSTWIGWVGPGVKKEGQTDKVWTDHTDIRPTMNALLGLKDDYVSDGRVVTEFLKGKALPKSLKAHDETVADLGAMWKQLNASFGQFSMDTLCASTAALASNTSGDTTYSQTESALQSLGAQRDTLADKIRLAISNAEFNGQAIDEQQAKDWIEQGQGYLDQASALCGRFSSASSSKELDKIKHFVVIYEENHSFDNLYGGWESVNGRANADAAHTTQINQAGNAYACLKQDDVNLASPPLSGSCTDSTTGNTGGSFSSHFTNAPFQIDTYIPPSAKTCPSPLVFGPANGIQDPNGLPGGCTRDLVHRFYQEPYQLHGGLQNRYVTGSDAVGLSMGYYDTKALPIYAYLHGKDHPDYAIDDNFFQSAFGGSYLNHQWLIAAATPTWNAALNDGSGDDLHSTLDANGMPNQYPLYALPANWTVKDQQLTQSCTPAASRPPLQSTFVCGNYTVNTTQPFNEPYSPGTALTRRVPPFAATNVTIGDELSNAGIDWAWYAGGWDNAAGNNGQGGRPLGLGWTNGSGPNCSDPATVPSANTNHTYPYCPDGLFQFHHQPFNYYANYAPGQPGRAHLQDELNFDQLAQSSDKTTCNLKDVSFIKPIGEENEHPGYASLPSGSSHLVELLKSIEGTACAKDTMVIVTYDEFGGQWDHVSPPGQGNNNGPHDVWGPGTRIPGLILAPHLKGDFVVDSAEHDTTSILATIEHRYGLAPLSSRDAAVNDLATAFSAKKP